MALHDDSDVAARGDGPLRQVAAKAGLSPKTVEVYLSRIYSKTGCQSRVELAVAVNSGDLQTRF